VEIHIRLSQEAHFYTFDLSRIASRKSAFGLSTKPPTIEVFSNSATRTPLRSCSFAKPTEIGILFSPRQILHEATDGVAVVLAESFRVEPFQRRQTWEKE
jgi:hypothetical protein